MVKQNPVKFLIEHQKIILDAYHSTNRSPKASWDALQDPLPGIAEAMTFNTFKQYITPYALIMDEMRPFVAQLEKDLDAVKQKLHSSETAETVQVDAGKLEEFRTANDSLKAQLEAVTQELYKAGESQVDPLRFADLEKEKTFLVDRLAEYENRLQSVTQELNSSKDAVSRIEKERDEFLNRINSLTEEKCRLEQQIKEYQAKLESHHPVTQPLNTQEDPPPAPPRNIDGWTVHKGKDGFFRLHRRIKGKLHAIYGGKKLDEVLIRAKIRKKEAKIQEESS